MIKILLDMNISPKWTQIFQTEGIEATHWSEVGDDTAKDSEIMQWAKSNRFIVFTHDLDFSAILAATNAIGPSVIQIRTQDVLPSAIGNVIITTIKQYASELEAGALITIKPNLSRVRILPLKKK